MGLERITLIIMLLIPGIKCEKALIEKYGVQGTDFILSVENYSESGLGKLETFEWKFKKTNTSEFFTVCHDTFGQIKVDPSFKDRVTGCNLTHLMLKNLTLEHNGWYLQQEHREHSRNRTSGMIVLHVVAETRNESSTTAPAETRNESSTTAPAKDEKKNDLLNIFIIVFGSIIVGGCASIIVGSRIVGSNYWCCRCCKRKGYALAKTEDPSRKETDSLKLSDVKTKHESTPGTQETAFNAEMKECQPSLQSGVGVHVSSDGGMSTGKSFELRGPQAQPRSDNFEDIRTGKQDFAVALKESENRHMNKDPQQEQANTTEHKDSIDPEKMNNHHAE